MGLPDLIRDKFRKFRKFLLFLCGFFFVWFSTLRWDLADYLIYLCLSVLI